MPVSSLIHDAFVLEHTYPKPVERVFSAFSKFEEKRRWYAGGGPYDVMGYELDFRPGGNEVLIGKMKAGTPIAGAVLRWSQTFLDITDCNRIVFVQTLDRDDQRISCTLITIEFRPSELETTIVLTHQGVYMEGADGPEMRKAGWQSLLDELKNTLG